MVFLGVLSVLWTGCLPAPQPLIVIVVLIVGFFFWESKLHTRIYSVLWYIITFLFLGWCSYPFVVGNLSEESLAAQIPIAAMQLSIFLLIYRVYNAKADRDYVDMFLLSFFVFVSSAGVSVEFYLFPLLLLYLGAAIAALTLFHFRTQLQRPEARLAAPLVALTGRVRKAQLLTPGFFGGILLISTLVAVTTTFLFLFFPRTASSDNPLTFQTFLGNLSRKFMLGSSGSVNLDIAGIINRNSTPVMRVTFPGRERSPVGLLWRRGALHQYDGNTKRWNRGFGRHSGTPGGSRGKYKGLVNVLIRKSPGLFIAASDVERYNSIQDLRDDPQLIEQRYTLLLNYTWTPIFSAFSSPVAVVANVPTIVSDVDESFYSRDLPPGESGYTVFSRIPLRPDTDRPSEDSSQADDDEQMYRAMKNFFTQLPSNQHPRFQALARQLTEGLSSNEEKARAIRNYLVMHCRYSLDLTKLPTSRGPLYDFLFSGKAGHCEYFASAMVILMRELGIPSRLAYGYAAGQWNPDQKTFEVRQLDAHAWAEVYLKGRGWTPFDPTPVLPTEDKPETFISILFRPATSFLGYLRRQWAERVVEYTRFRQRVLVSSITSRIKEAANSVKEYGFSIKYAFSRLWRKIAGDMFLRLFVPVAMVSVLLSFGLASVIRVRRRRLFGQTYRKFLTARRSAAKVKFYEKMLRLLIDKGLSKKLADTPLEFADKIVAASRPFAGVKTLTQLYYFIRFGDGKLSSEQSRAVRSILQQLSRLVPPRGFTQSSE